jgi:nicotinamidase-related amidase
MADTPYHGARTGLLLVDPSHDFLASEGKRWPLATEVAEAVNLLSHLRAIVDAARQAGMQVCFVPHHRWEPGDDARWKHANHTQMASGQRQTCAKDTWGGTFHDDFHPQEGDIIVKEHWA